MSTFGQLKTSVDSWLIRDDVAASGTDFDEAMLIAEAEIARDVRCVIQEVSATINFTGRSADLPADYLEERNPFIDDNVRKIGYMTPKAIREAGPWQNGRVGAFYTLEGNGGTAPDNRVKMTIAAAASVSEPLAIIVNYIARFAPLTADPDTNWLLQNHYDVYLYGALRAACELIQEDELEDRYRGKYDRAVAALAKHENRKRYSVIPKQPYNSPRAIV